MLLKGILGRCLGHQLEDFPLAGGIHVQRRKPGLSPDLVIQVYYELNHGRLRPTARLPSGPPADRILSTADGLLRIHRSFRPACVIGVRR
jgi:hypothetical protein